MALRTGGEPFNDASQREARLGRFVCTEKRLLIADGGPKPVIHITDDFRTASLKCCPIRGGGTMQQPVLTRAVEKLAHAGEQAGFTVEDMIRPLNAGLSVKTLLDLIERGLQCPRVGRMGPIKRRWTETA